MKNVKKIEILSFSVEMENYVTDLKNSLKNVREWWMT